MTQAQVNDTVQVHYTGKLDDGTVFDTSVERDPLEFTLGAGQVIPGFEKAIVGMDEGESKTVQIPSNQAYGEYRDDLVISVSPTDFPQGVEPEVGQRLQVQNAEGQRIPVTVTEVSDFTVKLDANHPLAGKDLIFDVELIAVV